MLVRTNYLLNLTTLKNIPLHILTGKEAEPYRSVAHFLQIHISLMTKLRDCVFVLNRKPLKELYFFEKKKKKKEGVIKLFLG